MADVKYRKDFIGLSTDTKPTNDVIIGSTFYETDTKAGYIYDGAEWIAL